MGHEKVKHYLKTLEGTVRQYRMDKACSFFTQIV